MGSSELYYVCIDFGRNPVHSSFTKFPLHLTLIPPFTRNHMSEAELVEVIACVALETQPFELQPNGTKLYGPSFDIPVTTLEPSGELIGLHHRLLEALSSAGCTLLDESYTGENYSPHVTQIDGDATIPKVCDRISVFRRDEASAKTKSIIAVLQLPPSP